MDVALHECGVTFVLDRAGVTGDDGASHNGMWDMSLLADRPAAAARRAARRQHVARVAARGGRRRGRPHVSSAYAKGSVLRRHRRRRPQSPASTSCCRDDETDVLVLAVGAMAGDRRLVAAEQLRAAGIGVTVVDPRWVKPLDPALAALAAAHRLVVSVEDNGRVGGLGAALTALLQRRRRRPPRYGSTPSRRSSSTTPSAASSSSASA
ncbi:MAG: transketolase C-terminal domain-containing protein [Nocardioidaceae bacterium]